MRLRRFAFAAAALAVLSGCATRPADPFAARRKAYRSLIALVYPGMTRRQLYALLPPSHTPTAHCPVIYSDRTIRSETPQIEYHPLDAGFSLIVQYQLANRNEHDAKLYHAKSFDQLLLHKVTINRQNPNDVLLDRPVLTGNGSGTLLAIKTDAPGQTSSPHSRVQH